MRTLCVAVGAAAALFIACASAAAADPFEGQPVVAVVVSGLKEIRESVVLEQMQLRPGRAYQKDLADADLVNLERLRVFSRVSIDAAAADGGVRVDVTVVETLRLLPGISIGLSDESGVSAGPLLKVLSIGGHPHDVSATLRWGGENLVQISEVSPFLTDSRFWHSAKLAIRDRDNALDNFTEHSLDFDGQIGLRANERWKNGLLVQGYGLESQEPGVTLSPDNHDRFFGVGAITEYDSRDSWTTPTRGWLSSVDALWQTGDGEYATVNVDARRYQPIASTQTVLATALLTLRSGERGVDVPTYLDYALGGANSIRGWNFASRRGKNQFIASLEHRYMVMPTRAFSVAGVGLHAGMALAAFGDLGSAWTQADEFAPHTIAGGGIGLRLFVPFVDMIRVDVAYGNDVRLLIGVNEKAITQRNRVR